MKKYIFGAFLLICLPTIAQLKGVVIGATDGNRTPLYGAKLKLLTNGSTASTGEDGTFELVLPKELPDTLVVKANGFLPDTIPVSKDDRFISMQITLYSEKMLPEVVIEMKRQTHSIARMKTLHVEELTSGELRKAACCNLSESFETNASVDVNITDAVSGAKKIQLMGLDGVYTQIQMENIPFLRGLESSFGLTSIPGTWIESIQITKGTGTVVNGFESMAGLVNLELKKPSEMERFFVNGYGNIFGRAEVNLNAGQIINSKWSTGTLAHASGMFGEMDNNGDGFRDTPKGNTYAFMNRWAFQGLPFAVEVANTKHAEIALKEGANVLWIGARTTVNPFAVQEIADALKGVNIPVMIKNPVNPDLNLWIGAFERLQHAGITDLVAIHRGFSVYKHEVYRNVPNWEIPIAFKTRITKCASDL